MAIWQKASQLQMPLSAVANLILSNEIDWHYRSPTVAVPIQSPPPPENNQTFVRPDAGADTPEHQALYKIFVERGGYPEGHSSGPGVVSYEQWLANRSPK
jgi:hypothetical protein